MKRQSLLLFFFILAYTSMLLAQPKYEGFGSGTRGGKGKPKVHVTNLNATGPGSLYAAIGSNRTIVFDVGGTINNFRWDASDENVVISYLTIDGSTAPAPGIALNNNNNGNGLSFQNGCHDIIIKNIRVRNAGNDGFNLVRGCHDIVFDHVSSANNSDGDLDITDSCYNITVQWSILGPGGPGWSGAMLIAYPGTKDISVHHNLFSSYGRGVGERNPLVHNATDYKPNIISYLMADFTNNVVWKWGNSNEGFGYGSGADYGGTLQVRNNFYQSTAQPGNAIIKNKASYGGKVFASGNVSGNSGVNLNKAGNVPAAWPVAPVTMQDACTAARKVLAEAGPRPLDSTDQVLINAVSLVSCPINQPPIANAGKDVVLLLPENSVIIKGSGLDSDGKITSYNWSKSSGPTTYTIKSTNTATTTFSNLVKGTYIFKLTVTDDRGVVATDNITVTVKPAAIPRRK